MGSSTTSQIPTRKINKLTNEIEVIEKYCHKTYYGAEVAGIDCLTDPDVAVATGQGIIYIAENGNGSCGSKIYKVDTNEILTLYPRPYTTEKTAFITESAGRVDCVNPPGSWDGYGTTTAGIKNVSLITTDNSGNLFFMDDGLLRKMKISTQKFTTIAGVSGQYGTVDGIGSSARFSYLPRAMFADGQDSIFILEGHAIRKLNLTTQEVTTFLGVIDQAGDVDGIGSAVRFNKPHTITGDRNGHLYIADANSETIKKIDIATKTVTVIIGTVGTHSSQTVFQPGPAPGLIRPVGMLNFNDHALYYTMLYDPTNLSAVSHIAKSSPLP